VDSLRVHSIVALLIVDLIDVRSENAELKDETWKLEGRVTTLGTGKFTFALLTKTLTCRITIKNWKD
jgi:hypothetical protein